MVFAKPPVHLEAYERVGDGKSFMNTKSTSRFPTNTEPYSTLFHCKLPQRGAGAVILMPVSAANSPWRLVSRRM